MIRLRIAEVGMGESVGEACPGGRTQVLGQVSIRTLRRGMLHPDDSFRSKERHHEK